MIDKIANGCSESRNRAKEKEEHERKQKSDLLEKKLQILKEQCYDPDKKLIDDKVTNYTNAIDAAMGIKPEEKKNPTEQGKARSDG
jgi:ribosomal protein S8